MTADAAPVCEHSTEAQGAWHKSSDGGPAHAPPVPRLAPKEARERREGPQRSPDAATIGCRVTHHPDGAGSAAAPPATPAKMPERRSWSGDVQPAMTKGQYNHNAKVQALAMEPAMQLLVQAAGGVPIAPIRPLQVLELGCSQGVNSIQPVKTILEVFASRAQTLRHGGKLEVLVAHDDLPNNDFEELLQMVTDPATTYVPQDPASPLAVYPTFIGRSCYERVLPSASVDLAFSFTTLQWLSTKPATSSHALFPTLGDDKALKAAYEQQALSDLVKVLRLRAAELVPGGMFQVHFPVSEDSAAGAHAGHWAMDALQRLVADWVASGKLRGQEVAAMSPPVHMRSEAAVREALRSVEDLWSVKSFFVRPLQGVSYPLLRQGAITPAQYAASVRRQVAAVMQGYMQGQLSKTRGDEAAQDIVVGLFDAYEHVLEEAPEEDGLTTVYFLLQRTEAAVVAP